MTPSAYGTDLLTQVLNASGLRHRVIAHNIANVNTPNFKASEVLFEEQLGKHLKTPSSVVPQVVEKDGPERVDGNTVDMDRELGALTKNALVYQAAVQILAVKVAAMRSAISGR